MKDKCELCGSKNDYLNFHHLIPRTLHSNKFFKKNYDKEYLKNHGIWICKFICHGQIHKFITEKEMGLTYNTLEKLLEHPDVKKFVEWRKKRL
jgi:5-methylcytosine-specific restriction endonuclease McrA